MNVKYFAFMSWSSKRSAKNQTYSNRYFHQHEKSNRYNPIISDINFSVYLIYHICIADEDDGRSKRNYPVYFLSDDRLTHAVDEHKPDIIYHIGYDV